MQAVLTVVADKVTDMGIAEQLGEMLVAQKRIAEVRPAVTVRGLSFILNPDTNSADRQAIIAEIKAAGFTTIE
jgi:hypothetical protein